MLQSIFIIIREDNIFFSTPKGFLKKKKTHILKTAKEERKKENIRALIEMCLWWMSAQVFI